MDSIADLLHRKANKLDDAGTKDDMELIGFELKRLYAGDVRIDKLNDGELILRTSSSSLASNIRLEQHQLLQNLNKDLKKSILKLRIRIG